MSDKSTAKIEAAVAAERERCINRVLTYAALRDQAAVNLDRAAAGFRDDEPSEGAADRARMQAEVARDVARFLEEAPKA